MSEETGVTCGLAAREQAKRQQILEGARRVFLAQGFDAASMGEIAREAGVSKGTLYVYFENKEDLFSALVEESRRRTAEYLLQFENEEGTVEEVLRHLALRLMDKLTDPDHISLVRMVIGASERFPAVAQKFYRSGPAHGAARLAAYFTALHEDGILDVEDPHLAAWQFMGMCNHPILIQGLVNFERWPHDAMERQANAAVRTFMAAYARRPAD
jgi:AcrR family transcriptional regulator